MKDRPRPSSPRGDTSRTHLRTDCNGTRRSAYGSGPSPSSAFPAVRARLLAAALDVALHELLGVLLEDIVDLVQEVVEVLLDLLALLGDLGVRPRRLVATFGLGRSRFFLLLLSHERLLLGPQTGPAPGPRSSAGLSPAGPGTSPACPRTTSRRPRPIRRRAPGLYLRWHRSWRAAAWYC